MKTRIRPSRSAFFLVPARPSSSNSRSALHSVLLPPPPVTSASTPDPRQGGSPTAAFASRSSAACDQGAPLSQVRTWLRCDSHAPNEPPSAGQRGVAEQSRLASVRAATDEWLESVVSLGLQNREVL